VIKGERMSLYGIAMLGPLQVIGLPVSRKRLMGLKLDFDLHPLVDHDPNKT
jgi:hypothetical protein